MKPSRYARIAVLVLHGALMAGLAIWCGLGPGLLLVLPLAAPLPGLLRGSSYTAGWASMLLVFYVAGLLAEGVAQPARRGIGSALAVLAALDFVALLLFVRFSARERGVLAGRTESSGGAGH